MIEALLCALLAFWQDPAPASAPATAGQRYLSTSRIWSLVLPPGWRQMTPDEALAIGQRFPGLLEPDLLNPTPGRDYCLGPVDEWVLGHCDGKSLAVVEQDGEPLLDESMLSQLRSTLPSRAQANGMELEIISASLEKLGPLAHPVAMLEARMRSAKDRPECRTLELYVPTTGRVVGLRFRCLASDWDRSAPVFRAVAASLSCAHPPHGSEKQGSKVLYAVLIGALTGLMLVAVRKRPLARTGDFASGPKSP